MGGTINNHLKKGYSKYVLLFLKRYHEDLRPEDKVLDVGCGHFRNLRLFFEVGFRDLSGFDKNIPEPIFKNRNFKVKFNLGDLEHGLPYADGEFNIILCNFVLMFIEPSNLDFVLGELLRVCKGFLVIETNGPTNPTDRTEFKDYSFKDIAEFMRNRSDIQILDCKNYYEKLLIKKL